MSWRVHGFQAPAVVFDNVTVAKHDVWPERSIGAFAPLLARRVAIGLRIAEEDRCLIPHQAVRAEAVGSGSGVVLKGAGGRRVIAMRVGDQHVLYLLARPECREQGFHVGGVIGTGVEQATLPRPIKYVPVPR